MDRIHRIFQDLQDAELASHPVNPEKSCESCPFFLLFESSSEPMALSTKSGSIREFEITVDRMPTRAGIDPYNKLIDRKPDDNVIVVGKAE
jgi:hypothetical protein